MTIETLLLNKTSALSVQFFRYSLVGGLAFVLDFACLFCLTDVAGLHYLLSAAMAFGVGLTTNYALSTLWVFHHRAAMSGSLHFMAFALIGVIGLGLNEVFIWTLTEYAHLHYLLSKIVSTIIVYLWNFLVRKHMLYR